MARIETEPHDDDAPRIDREAVAAFFEDRASKYQRLGPIRTVIYQDKNPQLAIRRNAAEKALLTDNLLLTDKSRVLDIGCGVGRWANDIVATGAHYHGIDSSPGLIDIARTTHSELSAQFSVCSIDQMSLGTIGADSPFDRILIFGVLLYLNDDELVSAVRAVREVAAPNARILLGEPVGFPHRLTVKDHFSTDMDQIYNAIYRTNDELVQTLTTELGPVGFRLSDQGVTYSDPQLNNRAETRQEWFLLSR